MAELSVQRITLSGLNPVYSNCDSLGDYFPNSGKAVIHIKNGDTVSHSVTVNSIRPCSYGYDHNIIVDVPAGEERFIGPFPKNRFDDENERVQISYDSVTSMTIAVLEVP